ncbi:MAG: DNA polymerase [Candidatus Coprovivens sp.]
MLIAYILLLCSIVKCQFGEPIFFEGEYKEDKIYDLYIQMITCTFKLKKNKIPTIQIKNDWRYLGNEYLETSESEDGDSPICLILTSIDLKLFLEQYEPSDLKYECGWKFRSKEGLFTEYIDKWIARKNEATITGNKGIRAMSKMMLNSLYGKFATSLEVQSKIPYLGEDEIIHYTLSEKEEKEGIYIPVGCFITAYAREKTIRTSQAIKTYSIEKYGIDKYIYSDTDSIHTTLSLEELKEFCDIDDVRLGAWKNEGFATKGKFVRQKCYLEEIEGKIKITCAGMPKTCYDSVNFENFKTGFTTRWKINI